MYSVMHHSIYFKWDYAARHYNMQINTIHIAPTWTKLRTRQREIGNTVCAESNYYVSIRFKGLIYFQKKELACAQ